MKVDLSKLITAQAGKRTHIFFVFLLFITCNFLSSLIPPFQSPDEFEHITRAYLFAKGVVVLDTPHNETSGGMIDSGLAKYMEAFSALPFHPERKISVSELDAAKKIKWSGTKEFKRAPGMAFYFPAIYSVHAFALGIGEHLNLSIDGSYKLTRFLLLLAVCCVLYGSFRLYPPSCLVLALLLIPMSLFQLSSASLDGIATALSIFIVSAFLRIATDKERSAVWLFYALVTVWLIVASSRVQQFSLIILVASCSYFMRKPRYLLVAILSALLVVAWQIVAVKTSVDGRVKLGASTSDIVMWYFYHPLDFYDVMRTTLTSSETWRSYLSSFFGMLGWLDAPFAGKQYIYLLGLTVLIAGCSVTYRHLQANRLARLLLVFSAFASVAMIYFALLVTWTPHPAVVVNGVVGRYFLIPAIMVAYALGDGNVSASVVKRVCGLVLLICLFGYSVMNTTELLSTRYQVEVK
jgi:uncharacterized membrane protein